MTPIKYDTQTLKIVYDISSISKTKDGNTPIKFVKDLEGVHIRSANPSKSIVYKVDIPSDKFDIPSDELCFYDYSEFYKYFSTLSEPNLSFGIVGEGTDKEIEAIVISKERRKISYPVSDPEVIQGALKNVKFQTPDTTFKFTQENLSNIKKIVSLFKSDVVKIKFDFSGKIVKITMTAENSETNYEDEFELDEDVSEEFSIVISQDVFKYLLNTNYLVEVSNEYQYIRFMFENDTIKGSILSTAE